MKLSIITVNLNNRDGLQHTIESVVSQSYKDYEWIIIDGGSTDGSRELIERYSDHFAYWVSEPDNGIYNAMNKGIRFAKGEYIQFLNSGDWYWDNTVLEKVFSFDPTAEIVYTDFNFVEKNTLIRVRHYPEVLSLKEIIDDGLCHNSTFTKRTLLVDNPYNEIYVISSDFEFFLRVMLENHSFSHIPVVSIGYDLTGISSTNYMLGEEESKKILESIIPPSIQKDLDNLDYLSSLPKNKAMREIDYYRENYRFYHKMITGSLLFMRFINRFFHKSRNE